MQWSYTQSQQVASWITIQTSVLKSKFRNHKIEFSDISFPSRMPCPLPPVNRAFKKNFFWSIVVYNVVLIYFVQQSDSIIYQFSSVAQLCPTLWDPMNRSMPGLPVHHQLPEFTQTHVHWVSDAIQPSHPLSSPSPPILKSFPASGSLQMSQLFAWGGQSTGVSALASFLPKCCCCCCCCCC